MSDRSFANILATLEEWSGELMTDARRPQPGEKACGSAYNSYYRCEAHAGHFGYHVSLRAGRIWKDAATHDVTGEPIGAPSVERAPE